MKKLLIIKSLTITILIYKKNINESNYISIYISVFLHHRFADILKSVKVLKIAYLINKFGIIHCVDKRLSQKI